MRDFLSTACTACSFPSDMGPVAVSVVSHGHGALLPPLLCALADCEEVSQVILTQNVPEAPLAGTLPARVQVRGNAQPKGFAANHNAAFQQVSAPYFAIINPDIRLRVNPFPALLKCLRDDSVSLCAPIVVNSAGEIEDSVRHFPTLAGMARRLLSLDDGRVLFSDLSSPSPAPWVAGMFMLVRSSDYAAVSGFDEGFFLYCEDIDLCARLWRADRQVWLCPDAQVVHDAQRASHRDARHLRWHLSSMMRYFRKHVGRLPRVPLNGTGKTHG
jgi:N-acetylglucosaminyl-diphospho-decaprenol L-rhamnosyltransferase